MTTTLLLAPTERELAALGGLLGEQAAGLRLERAGFGPVAAAARTMELLCELRPARVLLVGIAGTLEPECLPLASAHEFESAILDGVGAGAGPSFRTATSLGFPLWRDGAGTSIGERLGWRPLGASKGALLSVCAASADEAEAEARRARHPDAMAEEMEAYAVAFACCLRRTPLCVVRGISNVVGQRGREHWRIGPALDAAGALALERLRATGPWSAPEPLEPR